MCSSIRIATLINGYSPQLLELKEPYFVTLTAPTVLADELPQRIKHFGDIFRKIIHTRSARKWA